MTDREESLWFQELYLRFAKSLVRLSCRAGIELEISKEIMQQAFYLLLIKYDSLKDWHTNLPGWLIKTNSNLIKKELNAPRRKHEIPLVDWLEVPVEDHYHFPPELPLAFETMAEENHIVSLNSIGRLLNSMKL